MSLEEVNEALRATLESIVARNREGRDAFTAQATHLQSILLNGTNDDLGQFVDRLASSNDEPHGEDGADSPVGEAGSDG